MVNGIFASVWLIALWKWGDWRNWKKYYPTILFFILGDLLYLYLLSDHFPMWKYNPPSIDEGWGLTNAHISISVIVIKYPATMLIYLSNFPKENKLKQFAYYAMWIGIYAVNEFIDMKLKLIQYFNGWGYGWSMLFNAVMFYILWIHHRKPSHAWLLSLIFILFLWLTLQVPSTVFR